MNRERIDSLSVLLEFQESVLPERVKIGYMSFAVRPYIFLSHYAVIDVRDMDT